MYIALRESLKFIQLKLPLCKFTYMQISISQQCWTTEFYS